MVGMHPLEEVRGHQDPNTNIFSKQTTCCHSARDIDVLFTRPTTPMNYLLTLKSGPEKAQAQLGLGALTTTFH